MKIRLFFRMNRVDGVMVGKVNAGPRLFGLSLASSLKVIGAWMIVTPLFRASSASLAERSSIPVAAIDSLTASWSLPPSVVNSFWYSTRSSAVLDASMAEPPFASAAEKTRSAGTTVSAARSAAPREPAGRIVPVAICCCSDARRRRPAKLYRCCVKTCARASYTAAGFGIGLCRMIIAKAGRRGAPVAAGAKESTEDKASATIVALSAIVMSW